LENSADLLARTRLPEPARAARIARPSRSNRTRPHILQRHREDTDTWIGVPHFLAVQYLYLRTPHEPLYSQEHQGPAPESTQFLEFLGGIAASSADGNISQASEHRSTKPSLAI
jgi:hypothetical protein